MEKIFEPLTTFITKNSSNGSRHIGVNMNKKQLTSIYQQTINRTIKQVTL